jgi:hypothetical protein
MPRTTIAGSLESDGPPQARLSPEEIMQLLDRASDVVYRYHVGPVPQIEYVSRAVARLTGFTQAEHYAHPDLLLSIVHPDDQPLIEELLERGASPAPLVVRVVRRDHRLVWIEQLNTSVYNAAGELVAIEGIAREVPDPTRGRRPSVRIIGDVRIDTDRGRVVVDGQPVHLTPSEFRVLMVLTEQPGSVVGRESIMEVLWDSRHVGDARTSEVHVSKLRKKIERDARQPRRIETVRGQGYRFVPMRDTRFTPSG